MQNKNGVEIDLKVYIYTRPNLRDGNDFTLFVGRNICDNCFDTMKIDEKTTTIVLRYPERWLNILEQRCIFERIKEYYPNIKKLEIITHSVYIIQCTPNGYAVICDESSDYPDGQYGDHTKRLSPLPNEENGLMVFGGSIK